MAWWCFERTELEDDEELVVMSKHSFLRLVGDLIDPEREAELLGGYYDGSSMTLWELGGIEVGVDNAGNVYMSRETYKQLLREIEKKRRELGEVEP